MANRRTRLRALFLVLAAAACAPSAAQTTRQDRRATSDQQKLDRLLAGLTPGTPTTCLNGIDRRNARSQSIGGTTLYTISRRRIIRNDMNGNCDMSRDPILVTSTPSTSVCRGDIVQLIDRTSRFPIGSCTYGDFIPYTRAK